VRANQMENRTPTCFLPRRNYSSTNTHCPIQAQWYSYWDALSRLDSNPFATNLEWPLARCSNESVVVRAPPPPPRSMVARHGDASKQDSNAGRVFAAIAIPRATGKRNRHRRVHCRVHHWRLRVLCIEGIPPKLYTYKEASSHSQAMCENLAPSQNQVV